MKKLIVVVFTLIFVYSGSVRNQETKLTARDDGKAVLTWFKWNEGYVEAKKSNKIMLIDIYTDWCGWCKKMERDTYTHPEVIKLINKYFVPVKFNPEQRNMVYDVDGTKLTPVQLYSNLTQNQSSGYPTTVVLFAREKRVYLQAGYMDASSFLKLLNQYVSGK